MWRGQRIIGLLRVYVGGCAGSCSVGRPQKRWNDTVKGCLRKRGLDIRQARKMVQDRGNNAVAELEHYASQLPAQVLMMRDYNARHPIWDPTVGPS